VSKHPDGKGEKEMEEDQGGGQLSWDVLCGKEGPAESSGKRQYARRLEKEMKNDKPKRRKSVSRSGRKGALLKGLAMGRSTSRSFKRPFGTVGGRV